ncbi:3'-5' exonuclease [Croceicoccus marinus]|uniref:DNA polymerase III subunit epsilon n=1 Tax=Croceicoccus marinus TaxID=450378 RepID=A0A7G6VT23_9SPHN|nr:3'-5' exonuclease [Croceicoccus marinus]QNE04888.1 DNA polymerase III subunit epsilon [Croceicoccus marinus]
MTQDKDAELVRQIEADGDYRVLRKIKPPRALQDRNLKEGTRRIAILDVETTGLDPRTDSIIEIAVMTLDVDWPHDSAVLSNTVPMTWLQDPGRAISSKITAPLTGLTNEMLVGQQIDREAVVKLLTGADLIVAHNARFDRAFVEAFYPEVRGGKWACSCVEIDWLAHGYDGKSLGHLLLQAGYFANTHRADDDVWSLFHLLRTVAPGTDGRSFLDLLIERSEAETVLLKARGAPFSLKDQLKSRGYRWNAEEKVWWTEGDYAHYLTEKDWLVQNDVFNYTSEMIDASRRHL